MKGNKFLWSFLTVIMLLSMTVGAALAEDNVDIFRRNISKTPDNETEKAAIYMMDFYVQAQSSDGYVGPVDNYGTYYEDVLDEDGNPVYDENGDPVVVEKEVYEARDYAKPLISVYIDDLHPVEETKGGITFGHFDAFAGVSLDDGTSWKTTNISRSSDLSSFTLTEGYNAGYDYPGDVHNVVHQVAGDNIFLAWVSKYCDGGTPLYTLMPNVEFVYDDDGNLIPIDAQDDLKKEYMTDLKDEGLDNLYLYDLFGVAGTQGSVNYEEQGFPEIGEIPYSCVWTARGKLVPGDDPSTLTGTKTIDDDNDVTTPEISVATGVEAAHVIWTKPERLTSGKRDANLPAVDCAAGAGCILTWQEDPEGLRPGQGLGPGEGWSGAIANGKTDIWYSYIAWDNFDKILVEDDDGIVIVDGEEVSNLIDIIPFEEYFDNYIIQTPSDDNTLLLDIPKVGVPMAMPARLTDNNMCKGVSSLKEPSDPYCYIDFDTIDDLDPSALPTSPENALYDDLGNLTSSDAEFCASTIDWTTPGGGTLPICQTQDDVVLNGRVAATRVRLNLKPYTTYLDLNSDGEKDISAWVIMAYEETKAFGDLLVEDDDPTTEEKEVNPIEIGKDVWYHSFDMFKNDIVSQGGMINQPVEECRTTIIDGVETLECEDQFTPWLTDENGDPIIIDGEKVEIDWAYPVYFTEIARRFAVTTNSISSIISSTHELSAMLIYKQGIINQGGPADIFLRRVVAPDNFDKSVDNPYAFENIACDEWAYTNEDNGGVNPNYLKGVCLSPAINISGTTIESCTDGNGNEVSLLEEDDYSTIDEKCADLFPVGDDGSIEVEVDKFPKVMEWRQCDGVSSLDGNLIDVDGNAIPLEPFDCSIDNDLDDESFENPYDVAKGHRGFLDGDIVMMMYAWSPNWNSNAVGNDHYNLYVRRSFDGGQTWTTTPASLLGEGITGVVENYYDTKIGDPLTVEWTYDAGEFEQARNVSLLIGNKVTILDPRYTPTGGLKLYTTIRTNWLEDNYQIEVDTNADGLPDTTVPFVPLDPIPYTDDIARARDKFFVVYETGDNTTVAEGEAVPLDLFYSRATVFGDHYEWMLYEPTDSDPEDDVIKDAYEAWPWLEKAADDLSGEASVVSNPGGTFMYAVWNQWQEEILEDGNELVFDSDIIFRRLEYVPDEIIATSALTPIASIVSSDQVLFSTDLDETIILYADGEDLDLLGDDLEIVEYEWSINGQPFLYQDADTDCYKEKQCNAPAKILASSWDGMQFQEPGWSGLDGTMSYGWYNFQLRVKDNDGQWSKWVQVQKYIAKSPTDSIINFKIFLPLTTK